MRNARISYEQSIETKPTLVCFDFDQTILNIHSHNTIISWLRNNPGRSIETDYLKELEQIDPKIIFKNREKLLETFNILFKQGHNIAITSFTQFEPVIIPLLKLLGLSEEQTGKIHIEAWLPETKDYMLNYGKNGHIRKAMNYFKVEESQYVMLIDDSENNIEIAKHNNINAVLVSTECNPDPAYLDKIVKLGKKLIESAKVRDEKQEGFTLKEKHGSWVVREHDRREIRKNNQFGLNS